MKKILAILSLFTATAAFAQPEDPMQRMADSLDALNKPKAEFVHATFKTTRVINFPTVETQGAHILDFRINHRFGDLNTGAQNAFGIDGPASIRLGLDYGITDWLMIGIGRCSVDKLVDGSVKVRALRQTTDNKMPVSLSFLMNANWTFMKDPNKAITGVDKYHYPIDRMSYSTNMILGRKFGENFSLEVNGFWVHYNIVDHILDKNDIFAVGFSGRYKCTKRFAITWEYAHRLGNYSTIQDSYYDPIGIGFDLETGGHVFQIHFTNQFGMSEVQYIPYNRSNWMKGGIRLGFNISRVFTIGHHNGSTW